MDSRLPLQWGEPSISRIQAVAMANFQRGQNDFTFVILIAPSQCLLWSYSLITTVSLNIKEELLSLKLDLRAQQDLCEGRQVTRWHHSNTWKYRESHLLTLGRLQQRRSNHWSFQKTCAKVSRLHIYVFKTSPIHMQNKEPSALLICKKKKTSQNYLVSINNSILKTDFL